MFVIQVKSRKYRYHTLTAAKEVADKIFRDLGIVVGITQE